jgi:hypothetical protein
VFEQRPSLFRTKRARLADRQPSDLEWPHPHAYESADGKSEHEKTSSNLSFLALAERERQARSTGIRVVANIDHACRRSSPLLERNPALESRDRTSIEMSFHVDAILPLVSERGVKQHVSDIAVVGHQHQPGGLSIEATDGKQAPHASRQQVDDRPSPLVIAHGGDDSTWLVHDPIGRTLAKQTFPVETDLVHTRIGSIAELRHATIHRDPLFGQKTFDIAA